MARRFVFNPLSGKFDIIDVAAVGAQPIPNTISNGETFTVPTDTQALFARPILIEAGGRLLTEGTGAIVGVT